MEKSKSECMLWRKPSRNGGPGVGVGLQFKVEWSEVTIQHKLKISHRHVSPRENACQVEGIATANKHTLSDHQGPVICGQWWNQKPD